MIGGEMRFVAFIAHPDDELYSLWPTMHLLAAGYEGHYVFLTRGEVTAASLKLDPDPTHYPGNVQPVCSWPEHNYKHNPAEEQFTLPTIEQIGLSRLNEGRSCVGAMASIPPNAGSSSGIAEVHDENLGTAYGCGGCSSSTAEPTEEGIDLAEEVIRKYIDLYPNSFFYTHSSTDWHPDHAAAGKALRRLKGTPTYLGTPGSFSYSGGDPVLAPSLVNAMFFASKLGWGNATTPRDPDLAQEYNAWYPNPYPRNDVILTRRAEYTAWLRNKVADAYLSWNPAEQSFAIGGGHSTYSQMVDCILNPAPNFVCSALWHP